MITHTEFIHAGPRTTEVIHSWERQGWAVRQIIPAVSGTGYLVVFEEIATGAEVL